MHPVLQAMAALVPSLGVGLIFWWVIRAIVQADRRERAAMARLDAEERLAEGRATPGPRESTSDPAEGKG